jgi:transposase InsO family protein
MVMLTNEYGRYGHRPITAMLHREDWRVNHKRIERLRRREGLKVPARKPKRKRLWRGDGSCIRLRPAQKNHVWSYDFVHAQTHDGRPLRLLTLIDEYSRECLARHVTRRTTSENLLERLSDVFIRRGVPRYLQNDNGPEFTAIKVRQWVGQVAVKTLFVEPSTPWENGYIESFNGKRRDELLNREIFLNFEEARWVIDRWRLDYNHHRIHSSLDYQTPAVYAAGCVLPASATPQSPEHCRDTNPNPLAQPGAKTGWWGGVNSFTTCSPRNQIA